MCSEGRTVDFGYRGRLAAEPDAFLKKAEGESRRYLESLTLKATT